MARHCVFLKTNGATDEYLAVQIVALLAVARGASQFTISRTTQRLITNSKIVKLFLPVTIDVLGNLNEEGTVKTHCPG